MNMAEGKTIDVPSMKCESCEEADSSKFCIDCNQPLCAKCTQIHARLAPTKHHKPIPSEEYGLLTSTTKIHSQGSQCAKHPKKPIDKVCDDCLVVLCSDCDSDHTGHSIHQGSLDAHFLHRLSAQKIPELLDIIQQLRDVNYGLPEKVKLYKEAEQLVKSWKDKLLDTISKDADKLLGELQDEIRKQEKCQTETSSKVKECIVKADQQITKLSESRKISNIDKLLDQLSRFNKDIEDVKQHLESVKSSQMKLNIGDILPYKDEFDKAFKMVEHLFITSATYRRVPAGVHLTQKPVQLRSHDKLNIAQETTITGNHFRFCGTYLHQPQQIYLFQKGGRNVKMFSKYVQETSSFSCDRYSIDMIYIAPDRHISVGYTSRSVYLLDERFQNLVNIPCTKQDGYTVCRMCVINKEIFMVSEVNYDKLLTRFKEVRMNENGASIKILCEVPSKNSDGLMAYHAAGEVTFADTPTSLSTVNICTGQSTCIYKTDKVIKSICGDRNSILFGDEGGNVHKIEAGIYKGKILEGLGAAVTGLQPVDSGMAVLVGDKLQLYQ